MVRRPASAKALAVLACAAAVWAGCFNVLPFLAAPEATPRVGAPPATHGVAAGAGAAGAAPRAAAAQAATRAALLAAAGCALVAAGTSARTGTRRRAPLARVVRRAEADDSDDDTDDGEEEDRGGITGAMLQASIEDAEDEKLAGEMEMDAPMNIQSDLDYNEEDYQDEALQKLEARGVASTSYVLRPARGYVTLIAKKLSARTWCPDGPDGHRMTSYQVQIGSITEKIRAMIIHYRDHFNDVRGSYKHPGGFPDRLRFLIRKRRWLFDKVAQKDIELYIKLRDALGIRHQYKYQALLGRLDFYKAQRYPRPYKVGRKTLVRMKKSKMLLQKRLSKYLQEGASSKDLIHLRKKIQGRRWPARATDDIQAIKRGCNSPPVFLDPLNDWSKRSNPHDVLRNYVDEDRGKLKF